MCNDHLVLLRLNKYLFEGPSPNLNVVKTAMLLVYISDDEIVGSDEGGSEGGGYYPSDEAMDSDDENSFFDEEETATRFTDYSLTSSVMHRTDGLTLLDDRFEKVIS